MPKFEDRPVHRGLPVPWVARWTGEVHQTNGGATELRNDEWWQFPEISYGYMDVARDEYGILWQQDGLDQSGEPQFGQVNTLRQVSCMKFRRCQVCGSRITTPYTLFMFGSAESEYFNLTKLTPQGQSLQTTSTPPVCEPCSEKALAYCPDLRKGHMLVKVSAYKIVGVFGELFAASPDSSRAAPQFMSFGMRELPLGHPAIRAMLGKQLVVRFKE